MHNCRILYQCQYQYTDIFPQFQKKHTVAEEIGRKRKDSMKQKDCKKHFMFKRKAFERTTQAATIFMSSVLLVPQNSWFTVLPLSRSHGCCCCFVVCFFFGIFISPAAKLLLKPSRNVQRKFLMPLISNSVPLTLHTAFMK